MKTHFGYPMVCTKMWHVHFLSQRTLELAPFPAAPWYMLCIFSELNLNLFLPRVNIAKAVFITLENSSLNFWPINFLFARCYKLSLKLICLLFGLILSVFGTSWRFLDWFAEVNSFFFGWLEWEIGRFFAPIFWLLSPAADDFLLSSFFWPWMPFHIEKVI